MQSPRSHRGSIAMTMPPVIDVFRGASRRTLIEYALSEMEDTYVRTGEIEVDVDIARKTLTNQLYGRDTADSIGPLVLFGIVDPKHDPTEEEPNIPYYTLADTPVVDLLQSWDGYPLLELFDTSGAQKLVTFFLTEADPATFYSVTQLRQQESLGYDAASKYIDRLVDSGLVTTKDTARTTKYRVDTNSEIYAYLRELNNAVVETYEHRVKRFLE